MRHLSCLARRLYPAPRRSVCRRTWTIGKRSVEYPLYLDPIIDYPGVEWARRIRSAQRSAFRRGLMLSPSAIGGVSAAAHW